MKPEEPQIAIAEACGWTIIKAAMSVSKDPYEGTFSGTAYIPPGKVWEQMDTWEQRECFKNKPPNYLNDLNAIHEARRQHINTPTLRVHYMNTLHKIVGRRMEKNKVGTPMVSDFDCLNAECHEHANAFGLTLNLWKEEIQP